MGPAASGTTSPSSASASNSSRSFRRSSGLRVSTRNTARLPGTALRSTMLLTSFRRSMILPIPAPLSQRDRAVPEINDPLGPPATTFYHPDYSRGLSPVSRAMWGSSGWLRRRLFALDRGLIDEHHRNPVPDGIGAA